MDILERLRDTELNTSSDLFHLRKDAAAEIARLQHAVALYSEGSGKENVRLRALLEECLRCMPDDGSWAIDLAGRIRRDLEQ